MAMGNYEFQTEFAKKHRAAGRALGVASAIVNVLRTRDIALSSEQEKRILTCVNLDVLDRWIGEAVTVASADELFADSDFARKHRAAGRALGVASAIVTVLRTRGIAVSSESEKRILSCVDLDVLDRWIREAVTVASLDELFADSEFARKYRAAGGATAIVTVLRTRGIALSSEQEKRILSCVDLDVLDRWIHKAVTVASADELFAD